MTRQTKSMSTPLAQARGLGSAKSGLNHWWHQRVSAVAMVGLVSWMVFLVLSIAGADYETALNVVSHPAHAAVVVLLCVVLFWWLWLVVAWDDDEGREVASSTPNSAALRVEEQRATPRLFVL